MAIQDTLRTISIPKVFIAGLALVAAYYYGVYDDGAAKIAEIETARTEAAKIQGTLDENRRILANRAEFERELARVNEQYKAILEYLPPTFNTQDLLKKLSTEAKVAGVALVNFKPSAADRNQGAPGMPPTPAPAPVPGVPGGAAPPTAFYEEIKMDVELEGGFAQLMTFLSGVTRLQRLVNIRNIEMTLKGIVDGTAVISLKAVLISYKSTGG